MSEVIDGTESAGIKDPIKEKRCATDEIDDGPLTSEDTALNDVGTITYGITDMADDPRLEQAFSLIRAVIADADQRAQDDIVARNTGARIDCPKKFLGNGVIASHAIEQPSGAKLRART